MNKFSDQLVETLARKSGWSENRKVDSDALTNLIVMEGYQVLENVVEFMMNFDGLTILFENKRNGLKNDDIRFSFSQVIELDASEKIKASYEERLGKKLIPIGSAYRGHLLLLMSDDCMVYGAYDTYFRKIGDSGFSAIEAIVLDKEFEAIL